MRVKICLYMLFLLFILSGCGAKGPAADTEKETANWSEAFTVWPEENGCRVDAIENGLLHDSATDTIFLLANEGSATGSTVIAVYQSSDRKAEAWNKISEFRSDSGTIERFERTEEGLLCRFGAGTGWPYPSDYLSKDEGLTWELAMD